MNTMIQTLPCLFITFATFGQQTGEDYIRGHRHLQNITTESEVLTNEFNVGKIDDLLLQKIEQSNLYVIEFKKKIEDEK